MEDDRRKPPPHQISMHLPISGGVKGRVTVLDKDGRVRYRSSEFYALRDKLIGTLAEKKR